MRIVRNIGHVKRRKRYARIASILGFLGLSSTFALIFLPHLVVVAYALLICGFILFNFGMQQLGKWSHNPRHSRDDLAIDEQLQALPDRFVLFHYVQVGKSVVEHILLHPGGLLVLTARDLPGVVTGEGRGWRKKSGGFLRFFSFSGPQLGNPSGDSDKGVAAVELALADASLQVDVAGAIVFTSPSVDLDADETDPPAVTLEELPEFVKALEPDPTFGTKERDAIIELLSKGDELERNEVVRKRRPVKVKRRAA